MFDIGFWELTVIAVIGLIVLGPERLPVVARTLGTWVGRAKGYVRGLTSELEREVNVEDLRSEVRRTRERIEAGTRDTVDSVRKVDPREANRAPRHTQAPKADTTQAGDSANPVADAAGEPTEPTAKSEADTRANDNERNA
ncbi:Sec-independent protein translocase TatB [Salinisphaera sp. C84B14]|jgi:sec-independent protein translocase protein TatB|uniref:Sec-independent protein translocase protein TatB n=1 Tax=Salinisphaera sp. C84B14 TaxID=1304155 RepID=UPI00333E4129